MLITGDGTWSSCDNPFSSGITLMLREVSGPREDVRYGGQEPIAAGTVSPRGHQPGPRYPATSAIETFHRDALGVGSART